MSGAGLEVARFEAFSKLLLGPGGFPEGHFEDVTVKGKAGGAMKKAIT